MVSSRSFWWAALSLPLLVVGALAPWAEALRSRVDGTTDEVVLVLTGVAAIALVAFAGTSRRWLALIPLLAGVAVTVLGGWDVRDVDNIAPHVNEQLTSISWGLYLTVSGAVSLTVASALLVIQATAGAARLASRSRIGARTPTPVWERALMSAADRVPRRVAFMLMDRFQAPAVMDYAPEEIVLRQSSTMAAKRLDSVTKEPFTVAWIESFQAGDVFYDVGANVGAYSLVAAKSSRHQVETYAFEPSAPSYHDLCLNIAANGCDDVITPLPFALLAETKLVPFAHYSLEPGSSKHTFSFEQGRGDLELLYRQHAAALSVDDAIRMLGIPPPTHMKIDTETTEIDVLEGALETLSLASWRSVLTEVDDGETFAAFEALLAPFGFRHAKTFVRANKGAPSYSLFLRDAGLHVA